MIEPGLDDTNYDKKYLLLDRNNVPSRREHGPVDIVF